MTSEMGEDFKAMREASQEHRARVRAKQDEQLVENQRLAAEAGLEFRKCSEGHYQLSGRGLKLNLWPSRFKLQYCGKKFGADLRHYNWDCRSVIKKAIKEWGNES